MKRRDPQIMAARQAEWEQMTPQQRDAANAQVLGRAQLAPPEPTWNPTDDTDPRHCSPAHRQTFVVELATDGDVQGSEIVDVLRAAGFHIVEVSQPVLRSVANAKAFYCPTCEMSHEPPLHTT
jgi:hypothetical protein